MSDESATEEAAREVLAQLPRLVGTDAPRITAAIERALSLSDPGSRREALRQALCSDVRVRTWVEQRLDEGSGRTDPPAGYGYQPLAGNPIGAAEATKFECRNPSCPQRDTWWRSFLGEAVPRCSGCTRPLSRASE